MPGRLHVLALVVASALTMLVAPPIASAHPPPPPPPNEIAEDDPPATTTIVEWSTWLRGGAILATGTSDAIAARAATTDRPDHTRVSGAIGAGFTLPIGTRLRIGPWIERRTGDGTVFGGELELLGRPGGLDLFWYRGQSAIVLRGGASGDLLTAQLALAYRAPWNLFGSQPRGSRYMIGAALALTATQSRFDAGDYTVALGLEIEPVGALRYLLGVRSWY